MKPRIFISYKRIDKKNVFNLKDEIESSTGEKCWIDIDGIESDAQFKNVIINAIKDCEVVLFMYSKAHSLITDFEKDWTIRELNFAANKNKRIVFINLDGTPLTDEFSFDYGLKQQVDGQSKEAVTRLIADLKKWLKPIQYGSHETGKTIDSSTENKSNNSEEEKLKERSKYTFDIGISRKRKRYVVAVSVLASVLLLAIPSFWMFNSSTSPAVIASSSENVEDGHGIAHQDQFNGVDLGLPSGTIWANMNVGANSVSDFGDLFSWGESETKESYTDSKGSSSTMPLAHSDKDYSKFIHKLMMSKFGLKRRTFSNRENMKIATIIGIVLTPFILLALHPFLKGLDHPYIWLSFALAIVFLGPFTIREFLYKKRRNIKLSRLLENNRQGTL